MAKQKLHIDIETYSSIDIKTHGSYRYFESEDFEILMIAYALGDEDIKIIDLASGDKIPQAFLSLYNDPEVEKWAHNANFERVAFETYCMGRPTEEWHCSAVLTSYAGLPLSLMGASEALELGEKGKQSIGTSLIKLFSVPQKPTKVNKGRMRRLPSDDPEKWEQFKEYCRMDVEAEREITERLASVEIPASERALYILDQKINDRGVLVDTDFARNCIEIDTELKDDLLGEMKTLTGLENPNSLAQLRSWLSNELGYTVTSLTKDIVQEILDECDIRSVRDILELRQKTGKTSVKKYITMLNCAGADLRARGLLLFNGAFRTGRWAGRLVQLHNLPRNYIDRIKEVRNFFKTLSYGDLSLAFDGISSVLSQLIRTAFVAPEGKTLAVADFSAIEARVIAWLAGEQWRMDVFATHGKIYEASASMMFNIPLEEITKGSELRQKGKVAELALGYQGAVGAMKTMGAAEMGLSEAEMQDVVTKWRQASPKIVGLWYAIDRACKKAIGLQGRAKVVLKEYHNLEFNYEMDSLTIKLPSGRKLYYNQAKVVYGGKFGGEVVKYMGFDSVTNRWTWLDSYGGKFTENIIQAIARDALAESMLNLDKNGVEIIMHVHDEVVSEVPENNADETLKNICDIMAIPLPWAPTLKLTADGYHTKFYMKD